MLLTQRGLNMKELLLKLAYKILEHYKVRYMILPEEEVTKMVRMFVDQVEGKFGKESGEFKRHQVLRATKNSLPGVKERDIALAIEMVIHEGYRV